MQANAMWRVDNRPDIRVTKLDLGRLDHLLGDHALTWSWKVVEFLVRELMRAQIVDDEDIPHDIVTMRSRVVFREDDSRTERAATLAYPGDGAFYDDALSVLTPAGAALIGLSEGQSITYPAPEGRRKTLTVLKVISQPGRSGRTDGGLARRPSPADRRTAGRPSGASNLTRESDPRPTSNQAPGAASAWSSPS